MASWRFPAYGSPERYAMKLPIPRRMARDGIPVRAGRAIVEFGIASLLFLTIIFGTIDFGRAIFISAEIRNAAGRRSLRQGQSHRCRQYPPTRTQSIERHSD